ncbi:flagellar biosynthesis protein FlhF [Petroclostridium sp. X23]|uniref:flagellar biosynthesis protein FlhF n=1 Tax=Petroclostridium sp. X23 TaxID=3045146 RepID=UPI0024ADC58E|nr:flagellar biosynthesis protein FlhF [Petroclostridium sp. X23]WHH58953.1 flagellar biosynthesis protein FlhF [Petroclostridium sp. X23]
MKIRRYIGKDAQDAMMKVRVDLGSDAVILNTRKIKQKGLLKLLSKPLVEVLAAVDQDAVKQEGIQLGSTSHNKPKNYSNQPIPNNTSSMQKDEDVSHSHIQELEYKVKNMEQMLEKIYQQVQSSNGFTPTLEPETDKISEFLQAFTNNLLKNNVDIELVNEITDKVKESITDRANINDVAGKMYHNIVKMLDKPEPIRLGDESKSKIVAFVGPTGVGKTTTLAKIAAIFALNHKKNIGIITSDTYRMAAVEQLKTYTEILGLPMQVIYSPEEVLQAIENYKDKDLILLDTAGRSHKDMQKFEELKKTIEYCKPDEIYLLISVTTDYNVCKEVINSYDFLKEYRIIFTKMDESSNFGIILNIAKYASSKLSYVTTGQSVPDDIELLNIDRIAKKLLGSI